MRGGSGCNGKSARRGLYSSSEKGSKTREGDHRPGNLRAGGGANPLHREEGTPVRLTPRSRGRHQKIPKASLKVRDQRQPVSVQVGPVVSNSSKQTKDKTIDITQCQGNRGQDV